MLRDKIDKMELQSQGRVKLHAPAAALQPAPLAWHRGTLHLEEASAEPSMSTRENTTTLHYTTASTHPWDLQTDELTWCEVAELLPSLSAGLRKSELRKTRLGHSHSL